MSTQFSDAASAVEEVATSAAKVARKVAADPVGTARKQVTVIERRSARVARRINHRVNARLRTLTPEKVDVWGLELNTRFPERAAVKGLHIVKAQSRRNDPMGRIAKGTLRLLHASFRSIARLATRFEQASEPVTPHAPAHRPAPRKAAPRRRVARAAR
jgi:hypothetical protein